MNPNWYQTFFEGLALDMWRFAMTPEMTAAETGFLVERLQLRPGASVLDVPCGNGRHSIELARRGFCPTGVDLSAGFIAEARAGGLAVEWVHGDMRELPWQERFDGAFCWGNSFGYFDYEQCNVFLAAIRRVLKPGARFVLQLGAVTESLLPTWKPEKRFEIGAILFESSAVYDAVESRMDITYTFTRGERKEVKSIHQWVHGVAELRRMMRSAGLEPEGAFADTAGTAYQLGSMPLILVARRL